jgi:hypothetical protein
LCVDFFIRVSHPSPWAASRDPVPLAQTGSVQGVHRDFERLNRFIRFFYSYNGLVNIPGSDTNPLCAKLDCRARSSTHGTAIDPYSRLLLPGGTSFRSPK